ncbi:MAG: hypothetical protein NVSMB25_21360 [Thermoleophilaceae bacterium]
MQARPETRREKPGAGATALGWVRLALAALGLLVLLLLSPRAAQAATPAGANGYLALADQGIARAQGAWVDRAAHWYDERLGDGDRYPLATIWGVVPLFEALSGVTLAKPDSFPPRRARALCRWRGVLSQSAPGPGRGLRPLPA